MSTPWATSPKPPSKRQACCPYDQPQFPQSPPYDVFKPFSRLPKELQIKIWRVVLQLPRVVCISSIGEFPRIRSNGISIPHNSTLTVRYQAPALLSTCQDSREEALKVYTLAMGHWLAYPIYFSLERDVLHITNLRAVHGAFEVYDPIGPFHHIQNLKIIPLRPGHLDRYPDSLSMLKVAAIFPDLQKLYLVDREGLASFRTMDPEELKQENLEQRLWTELRWTRHRVPAWNEEGRNWKWPRFIFTTEAEFPSLLDSE